MIVGEPAWNQPLRQLLNQTGCTRETCFISSSLVNADGADIAPDNYYLLTSFPNVDNLQKANVQVENTFARLLFFYSYSIRFTFNNF